MFRKVFYLKKREVRSPVQRIKDIVNKLLPVLFIILLIGIWQAAVTIGQIEMFILPSPVDVIKALIGDFNIMKGHILVTLCEGVSGLLISIVLALILAVIMDMIPKVKRAVYPVLVISQTIPVIALAPLLIIWFGFGMMPKIVIVVIMCFFPIVISISDGMESVDKDLINHFKLMGASKIQRFIHLKLPYGLINFFAGLKIAATYSIMGAVVGEWIGGQSGLGVYMTRAKSTYAIDKMFAAILVIVIISMLLFLLIELISKLCMPWNKSKR